MKKFMTLLLTLAVVFSLAACGSATKNGDSTKGNTATDNVLRVGMECNYAPYNWSQTDDANGAIAISNVDNMYTNGYDVQVAKKIADSLGKKLEIYAYEWDSLIPAAQSGTFHLDALTAQTEAQVNELADFSTMFMALSAGTIEGYIAEEPTAMSVCRDTTYSYVPLENDKTGFTVEPDQVSIAVGVKKGSDLKEKINTALADFDTDAQKELMSEMVKIAPAEEE